MEMTVTISWWIAPTIVTVIAFGWAFISANSLGPSGDYGRIADGMVSLLYFAGATIVSLLAWLLWAIFA